MSRARNLKPGFFRNEELASLTPLTRIFFQGLWCEADRRGIVEDRPKRLKADILPYDKANVEEMLKTLESSGFIKRYEVDGVRCILVVNFTKHQNPHRDEKASDLPAPCQHSVSTVPAPERHDANTPLTLNTDSLSPDSLKPNTPPTPRNRGEYSEDFERWFSAYPRGRGSKKVAHDLWRKLAPDEQAAAFDALPLFKAGDDWKRGYHPAPEVWLRGKRWENPPPPAPLTEAERNYLVITNGLVKHPLGVEP